MKLTEKGQKFFDQMIELAESGKSFNDIIVGIVDEVESVKDAADVVAAVKQIEEKKLVAMRDEQKDLKQRLLRAEKRAMDGVGRYRGLFGSEDAARSFGLFVVGKTTGEDWAREALVTDYKDLSESLVKTKAFTTTTADAVIPESWNQTMVNLLEDHGVFERNALYMPMPSDLVHYSKKTGRIAAVPMSEGGALGSDNPTLQPRSLTARKWGAYTEINSEADDDSIIAIAEFIAADMGEAHALAADQSGFLGDGTGAFNQITGILNALGAAAILTMAAGKTAWSDFTLLDFESIVGRCVGKTFVAGASPKWYCSHQFFWQVMVPLTLASGGVTAGEIEGVRRPLFLGFPVEFTQVMPTTSAVSQIPFIFGSLRRGSTFGDRRRMAIKASEHFKFANDQTAMLSTRRYDIDVHGAGDATKVEVLAAGKTAAA